MKKVTVPPPAPAGHRPGSSRRGGVDKMSGRSRSDSCGEVRRASERPDDPTFTPLVVIGLIVVALCIIVGFIIDSSVVTLP